jgi:EAL and modified HD-GYP domain-containing signal transduction protein
LIQQLHGGLGSTTAVVEGIKRDPALVQGLLRYVNSGLFRWVSPIDSIEHAVNMLGRNELLRWAALMAAQQANGSGLPANTALTAITRGRFCELTANSLDSGQDGMDYFLVGLFSLADCMFGVALPEALTYVPLSPPMLAAIAEDAGEAGLVLRAARAIERGNVGAIQESAQALGVTPDALQTSYLSAARWGADCV